MSYLIRFLVMIFMSSMGWDFYLFLFVMFFISFRLCVGGEIFNRYFLIDSFRIGLIVLRMWIGSLILLASLSYDFTKVLFKEFTLIVLLLVFLLILSFSFSRLFLFYIAFEFTIVPTFLLILGWGYRVERFQAGLYMFVYTLVASLPFLLLLFILNSHVGSMNFSFLFFFGCKGLGGAWWLYSSLVFLVKLPIFLVHLWLPKAHVEAPLAGSIILAGVLLKLGGYGLLRCFNFCTADFIQYRGYLGGLGLIGGVIISFVCIRQVDLKCLIAYSSVAHIGSVLCGLICFLWIGNLGAYLIILAHGICSSGLFCLLNLMYERWGSRSVILMKGGLICAPILSFWWFIFCVGNISCPPSLNFVSEIMIVLGILSWRKIFIWGLLLLLFIRGVYTIYFFVRFSHGSLIEGIHIWNLSVRENLLLLSHSFPMFIVLIVFNLFCYWNSLRKILNCGFRDVFDF
jgi:NADH-ubiquinone oxidoreductase chain 4